MSFSFQSVLGLLGCSLWQLTQPGGTHLAAYLTYASEIFDFLDTQKKP